MVLSCPQCHMSATYVRGDFSGKWVVCHHCEVPFTWRTVSNPRSPKGPEADRKAPMKEKTG